MMTPDPPPPLSRPERVRLAAVFSVSLALFASLRTPDFNDWDGVNFALAVRDGFDLGLHQPHPPGFPLYILAAKAVHLAVRDPLSALTLLSALGGASSLVLVWWLARMWWPAEPAVAWLAAGWLLVTPHFWLSAEKELSDGPTLALHLAAVAFAWRGLWSARWRALATLTVAAGLGFRAQNAAGFVPPWLFLTALSVWARPPAAARHRAALRALIHLGALGALCACWFIGMAIATGGWAACRTQMAEYTAFLAQFENTMALTAGFDPGLWAQRLALHANTYLLCAFGLVLSMWTRSAALILWVPGLLAGAAIVATLLRARSAHAVTAALWALPYLASEILMFQPSNERYALPLVPPVILFVSAGLVCVRWPRLAKIAVAAPVLAALATTAIWCVRVLRTEPSPFVATVHWAQERVGGPVQVEGEASRALDYYRSAAGDSTGQIVLVAPPGDRLFDIWQTRPVLEQRRFTRSLTVHTKHHDLVARILR